MSKENRRRQRPGSQPPTTRPSGAATPGPAAEGTPPGTPPATTGGPVSPVRPTSTAARHGRRERPRSTFQPSFLERYRTAIVVVAALAGVALLSAFVFFSASQSAYACSTIWTPTATASPSAGATPNLGYVQPDMGRDHPALGTKVTYAYCAPASGSHYNKSNLGPIPARQYSPGDNAIPEGWLHNLEHGGLVLLYKGDGPGATADGQAQLRAIYDSFPAGPVCGTPKGSVGPVIARFDQMSTPFQAILWGRVLPLDTLDQARIFAFWNQWGERTNPEKQCAAPSSSPTVTTSSSPTAAPSPSSSPSATVAPSPS